MLLLSSADSFKIIFFKKFFQERYKSSKQYGSRSGPTLCLSSSGSKLFAKDIDRRQNLCRHEHGKSNVFACLVILACLILLSADFFQIIFFQKDLSGIQ